MRRLRSIIGAVAAVAVVGAGVAGAAAWHSDVTVTGTYATATVAPSADAAVTSHTFAASAPIRTSMAARAAVSRSTRTTRADARAH